MQIQGLCKVFRPASKHPVLTSIAMVRSTGKVEDIMLKQLSLCIALIASATAPVAAQPLEAVLQKVEVAGSDFDIVLAMPKSPARTMPDLSASPDALLVHLIGGQLVLGFDNPEKMLGAVETLRSPVCTIPVENKDSKSRRPLLVFVTPKSE